jgi:hypothetical protein
MDPVLAPLHRTFTGTVVTVKEDPTVTTTVSVPVQPPVVPVTIYVVVDDGLALTVAPVVALNPEAGDQLYVVAPLAVREILPPGQMDGLAGVADTVNPPFETVALAVPVQPFALVMVTVYVPAASPVAVAEVCPPDDHKYVKGVFPADAETVAVPLLDPQEAFVVVVVPTGGG